MIKIYIKTNNDLIYEHKITSNLEFEVLNVSLKALVDNIVKENEIFIGFKIKRTKDRFFLMTHEEAVVEYNVPFAFPVVVGTYGNYYENGLLMIFDYYELEKPFLRYKKYYDEDYLYVGITNNSFSILKDKIINIKFNYKKYLNEFYKLKDLIKNSANYLLNSNNIIWNGNYNLTANIYNYEEAAYGLSNNLMDFRARIQDGIGTFIPYGYKEEDPYSESFVLMDVAKGMLPYSIILKRKDLNNLIMSELYKMVDNELEYKWIDRFHNTDGFFHLAWGGVPVANIENIAKSKTIGKFTDVDGHEEGPNLLSTWKYFYRIQILGEMALLANNSDMIRGFLSTLPFVNKLKMKNYQQPVTYDLDTHLPVTGKDNGGSVGGIAFWSIIHLTAFDITKNKFYLKEAIKALEEANKLDFNNYFGMRVSPKPTTASWLTKSNIYAYELTKDERYLKYAESSAESIYFNYYLNAHPYTYFKTEGFGYACSKERWEAFLEMVESLYNISFYLKYSNNKNLLKLFWHARENWLWALPLNGNPYGNLNRPYDSIGGEYIPYEFSTGSLGDNPGLEGGSQSLMRQIKEIYGSGELYLAYLMFEMHAKIDDRSFLIIKSNYVNKLLEEEHNFIAYNTKDIKDSAIINFSNLSFEAYQIFVNDVSYGKFNVEQLKLGIKIDFNENEIKKIKLIPINKIKNNLEISNLNKKVEVSGNENINISWEHYKVDDFTHYIVKISNILYERTINIINNNICLTIDRELDNEIEIILVSRNKLYYYPKKKILKHLKKINYPINFESHEIEYKNFDLINDNHMLMFYGKDEKKEGLVQFIIAKAIDDEILKVDISSLNTNTELEIFTKSENELVKIGTVTNPKLIEISLLELGITFIDKVIIKAKSNKGLGFSIKDLIIYKVINKEINSIIDDFENNIKIEEEFIFNKEVDTSYFNYVDILINNSNMNQGFSVYFNEKEMHMKPEIDFPNKKYRKMNGFYRFKSPKTKKTNIKIVSKNKNLKVYIIKLTNDNQYPKYGEIQKFLERKAENAL